MMSSKDRVGPIIKAFITVVTLITLTSRFCIIKAAFDHMLRLTRRTCDAIGPAQLTNGLITLHVIDEMLDVNLHDWTPVRDRKMGWRQYTPSSNATTLESKKSVQKITLARRAVKLTPGAAARMAIGAYIAKPQPAPVGTIAVRTKVYGGGDLTGASIRRGHG